MDVVVEGAMGGICVATRRPAMRLAARLTEAFRPANPLNTSCLHLSIG